MYHYFEIYYYKLETSFKFKETGVLHYWSMEASFFANSFTDHYLTLFHISTYAQVLEGIEKINRKY